MKKCCNRCRQLKWLTRPASLTFGRDAQLKLYVLVALVKTGCSLHSTDARGTNVHRDRSTIRKNTYLLLYILVVVQQGIIPMPFFCDTWQFLNYQWNNDEMFAISWEVLLSHVISFMILILNNCRDLKISWLNPNSATVWIIAYEPASVWPRNEKFFISLVQNSE